MSEANLALQTCKIIVHRARNLIVKGRDNTNSSYAVISSGKEKFQTAVVDKTLFPQWNEECLLHVYKVGCSVEVIIYNRGLVLDDLIGQVSIPLSSIKGDGKAVRSWYKLEGKSSKSKKERGDVEISIQVKAGLNPYTPVHSWNMAKMKKSGDGKDEKTSVQKDDKASVHDSRKEKRSSTNVVKPQEMKQSPSSPESIPTSDPSFVRKAPLYGSTNDLNKMPTKTPPTQRRRLAKYAPAHRRLNVPYANIDPNTSSPGKSRSRNPFNLDANNSSQTESSKTEEDSGGMDRRRPSLDVNIFRSYQTLPHHKLRSVNEGSEKKPVQRDVKFRHSFHSSAQMPSGAVLSIPAKSHQEPPQEPPQDPQPEPEKTSTVPSDKPHIPDSPSKIPPVKPPRHSPSKAPPAETKTSIQSKPGAQSQIKSARLTADSTDSGVIPSKVGTKKAAVDPPSPKDTTAVESSRTPSPIEPKPVIINIDDSVGSGYVAPTRPNRKPKAMSTPMARFANMSKEDLAGKILDLEEQLHQQSTVMRETQEYLNTLLLRVIVQNPGLLNRDLDIDY
ncbi:rab11 family-interacting protein 2-like [Anneissia japonica]|uniref:rab11 family-interacting protein 2-like n=1 Tax=Anneissia japonica TaxID=1529436 RepID=UPI0014254F04|nr:rab11 family-interacting protein 2-like [Anneissia japonica]